MDRGNAARARLLQSVRGALRLAARCAGLALIAVALLQAWPRPADAVIEIDITRGNIQPLPIAIPEFTGGNPQDTELGADIANVIQ
ncbi:MAG TPA: hypothetical protein VK844_00305, partial [Hyphomicrobiales bacterium]|nr:hypothetical protein [Hyphomicrobiales bacterium]